MDFATIIGVIAGFSFIIAAMLKGGSVTLFLDLPGVMIVVGGMVSATFIHFSIKNCLGFFGVLKKTLICKLPTEDFLIQELVNYAAINRRDGALALEQHIQKLRDQFVVKGVQMLIDGQKEESIHKHMTLEITYLQERHAEGKKMLEFMGSAAPAWGMIGTLIGLVQMLSAMEDPSKIGEGMATSLVCTFYGAFFANMVLLPLAGKVGFRSKKEALMREMIVEGLLAIARGEGPTGVREKMQAFISARRREEVKPRI
jgi:chemotaxis protein MotA